jgi:hypothetical protein
MAYSVTKYIVYCLHSVGKCTLQASSSLGRLDSRIYVALAMRSMCFEGFCKVMESPTYISFSKQLQLRESMQCGGWPKLVW